MTALTFEQYQCFLKERLKVKITQKESIFFDYICPVHSIGIGWVSCDVDNDGGTHCFDLKDIEITDDQIKYDEY